MGVNGRIHIEEGSVQETLIIPLYGRKLCADVFPALYNDEGAKEICERLDYDFTGLDHQANSTFWRFGALEVAMRQLDMQWEIRDYLKGHPLACVVNMGCGLDQTGSAADNGTCNIVNVDMPDIIAARRELVPTGARERNVAADLRDLAWLDEVCGSHGAIFFAAGVFHYLTEAEVRTLVRAIGERFGGARLVFDAVGRLGRRLMRASFKSFGMQNYDECLCVDDPEALRAWCPGATLTYRGYMLGYQRMVDPAVTHLHRLLARVCDGPVKMRIFRFDFCE